MYGVGLTDIGMIRTNNEDYLFISDKEVGALPNVYIVADGMGGHNAGEVASSESVKYFLQYIKENTYSENELLDFLISALVYANKKIYEKSQTIPEYMGMGTTFTACVLKDNKLFIVHIGDSRIYKIHNDKIKQLTTDHTYVSEMIKSGKISDEQAKNHPDKNVVTRALGVEEDVLIDGVLNQFSSNDKFLICSDGLTNMLSDQEILKILNENDDSQFAVSNLINLCNLKGAGDNISVVLITEKR